MSRYLLFLKKLILFSHQLNSKNNGPVLLFKTIFRHRKSFLSSDATNDTDGYGLELENVGVTFSSFKAMPAKSPRNIILWLVLLDEICLISCS